MRIRITLSCNSLVFCKSCSNPLVNLSTFDISKFVPNSDNMDCVITSSPTKLIKLSTLSTPTLIEPTSVFAFALGLGLSTTPVGNCSLSCVLLSA